MYPNRFADLPGLRLHYIDAGPSDAPAVVLLHGFPEFWYSWRHQIPELIAAGYRVIAPDQRGYNLSDTHGPYDLATLVQDVIYLLDHLELSTCHLVGHDWGGVVAYTLAAAHPHRLVSLSILNAPHLNAYLDALRVSGRQRRKSWYVYYFQLPWLPEWSLRRRDYAMLRAMFRRLPPAYHSPADTERYVEVWSRPGALSAMVGWYRHLGRHLLLRGMRLPPMCIETPTLVIWGERDAALDKVCNRTLPRYVANLTIHYLPGISHWVQMHDPPAVNRLLLQHLAAHGHGQVAAETIPSPS
ncbi:MAG: alpha/beta fold hydrolase [Caldilineae bacterium]|nr:MAG: alpha/beta fold hydrolase [Caldilineae bacterium]